VLILAPCFLLGTIYRLLHSCGAFEVTKSCCLFLQQCFLWPLVVVVQAERFVAAVFVTAVA
jgi:hypothetical protein